MFHLITYCQGIYLITGFNLNEESLIIVIIANVQTLLGRSRITVTNLNRFLISFYYLLIQDKSHELSKVTWYKYYMLMWENSD